MATQQAQDDLIRKSYSLFEDELVSEIKEQREVRIFCTPDILIVWASRAAVNTANNAA